MRFPVVLFDFDGTIVDSARMIEESFRHTFETVLGRELDRTQLPDIYRLGELEAQMRSVDVERVDELTRVYREINAALHSELETFPGVVPLLETLKREGRKLGIVTSKRTATVEIAFDLLPLGHLFDVVVGAADTERHKPHPEPLLHALVRLDANPAEAAYVGDAPMDVEAARAAGVHSVAVAWGGFFGREQTLAAQPDSYVETPEELLAVL